MAMNIPTSDRQIDEQAEKYLNKLAVLSRNDEGKKKSEFGTRSGPCVVVVDLDLVAVVCF